MDPLTKLVIVNSEDGQLYRWDLTTNTLSEVIKLSGGISQAYTPTVIGIDGTVYAINDGVLNAIGNRIQDRSIALFRTFVWQPARPHRRLFHSRVRDWQDEMVIAIQK